MTNHTPEPAETPLERILGLLDRVTCSGAGYKALCPAHDDRNPSLSIKEGEDSRVLLHCFAGCAPEDVVGALDLKMGDLFPPADAPPVPQPRASFMPGQPSRIAATYSYHDAEGTLLYQVVRQEPKDFRQHRPDGRGGWIPNLAGVTRVLYRLPELLQADPGATVFLVEGEKDADALARLGRIATTNCGGAGKWRDDYTETLRGHDVAILPDNDDAGHAHAEKVASALAGVAASVRVVELPGLPPKGDVSDWLGEGHTSADLDTLTADTPLWRPRTVGQASQALAAPRPAHERNSPPDPPHEAAFYGLAGDIVRALDPTTEADPVAVLLNFLAAFGNIIGTGPHWEVSGGRHSLRVYPVLVGETGKGRKGTSWSTIRPLLADAAPEWFNRRVASGLSSGEGLIHHVRDPLEKQEPIRAGDPKRGPITGYAPVITDAGVADKRLFVVEEEFASTLKVMGREGNTLSPVIRQAWDGGTLSTLTKNSPERATGAHITILGHITKDELLRHLTGTEAANGFANRFLWVYVKRSKLLPYGGMPDPDTIERLAERLRSIIAIAQGIARIERDEETTGLWGRAYGPLSEGGTGLVGAILGRPTPQVLRLAALYAVLDGTSVMRRPHLEAALAVWDYVEASAQFIFGEALGDPMADTIMRALRASPEGLTQTEISELFGKNQSKARLAQALDALLAAGKIRRETRRTEGRDGTIWHAL